MRRATTPRPMVASTNVSQIRPPPSGLAKPRVNKDEPLVTQASLKLPIVEAPEDEGEADGDEHAPGERQGHQRHRRVEAGEAAGE